MNARWPKLLVVLALTALPVLSHAQGKGGGRPRGTRKATVAPPAPAPAPAPSAKVGDKARGGVVVHVTDAGKHGLVAHLEDLPVMGGMIFEAARQGCENLVAGGFSDWYLPSTAELGHVREQRAIAGSFPGRQYWTSTRMFQQDHKVYWIQWSDALSGWSDIENNGPSRALFSARCVRKF